LAWAVAEGLVVAALAFAASARPYGEIGSGPLLPRLLVFVPAFVAFPSVGVVIVTRYPTHAVGWLFIAMSVFGASGSFLESWATYILVTRSVGAELGQLLVVLAVGCCYVIGTGCWLFSLLLFPDGRLPSRRWRPVALALVLSTMLTVLSQTLTPGDLQGRPGVENPLGITASSGLLEALGAAGGVLLLLSLVAIVASLVIRLRRARGTERQQLKWFAYAGVVAAAAFLLNVTFKSWPVFGGVAEFASFTAFSLTAVIAGVAILRYRLWDIDLLINRTVVYVLLSACVIGAYVLLVGGLGALVQTGGNPAVALLATGIVAVLFQPLRERLQRGVNRFLYGERDEPYRVLSRLGQRLDATLAPEAVLPTIVQTVREALKLPYAGIALDQGGTSVLAASTGTPDAEPLRLPLAHQHERIGELVLGHRRLGEAFSPADRRLLDDLTRQAGVAVQTVRLTSDVQRSRERLVTAREEERRRLRRDLHDGLGAQLAALHVQAGVLRHLTRREPEAAEAAAAELQAEIRAAIGNIRHLVDGLRPPALDELGLVAALQEHVMQLSSVGANGQTLSIVVDAPVQLPDLPAAVEVAAYRIVQEAVTNVLRHAHAGACVVRLRMEAEHNLEVCISDDGRGVAPNAVSGVGFVSMRERAAELGGSCVVGAGVTGGTEVLVRLPVIVE
jgi:signal transduction histidine kinase